MANLLGMDWDGYEYNEKDDTDVFYIEDEDGILDAVEYDSRPIVRPYEELQAKYFADLKFWLDTQPHELLRELKAA